MFSEKAELKDRSAGRAGRAGVVCGPGRSVSEVIIEPSEISVNLPDTGRRLARLAPSVGKTTHLKN